MSDRRSIFHLLAALVAVLAIAACGGDSKSASADSDVNQLLAETFAGDKKVESGRLALALRIDAKGGQSQGPIDLKLTGPFQSQGTQKLPKFDLDVAFSGQGQSIKAGASTTGDRGFVNFNGTEYAVSPQVFRQFQTGYEEAQKQAAKQQGASKGSASFSRLGIDPRKWLTNPKNEGEAKVGDADTIRITGGVAVPKLLDDVNVALEKASSLGLQNAGQLPQKLTDAQRKQISEAVKDLTVEIYTGKDDKVLRRMVIALAVDSPAGASATTAQSAAVKLDFSLTELNQEQEVTAPAKTKPFDELLSQLGGLGGLGALGGGGTGGAGAGSATPDASGGAGAAPADQAKLKEYTDCITKAGSDTAAAQKCAALLTP